MVRVQALRECAISAYTRGMDAPITSRNGGARPGAGRKPAGYVKPQEKMDFDMAKARKEAALADMQELNFKIKTGEYIPRDPVREASATLLANIAQTLRSLPDHLERKLHLAPEVTEALEKGIDAALSDLADGLELMTDADAPADAA